MMMHLVPVGMLDPADVIAALERHEAEFGAQTWRQDTQGSAHADTESLYLRMPPKIDAQTVFHGLEVTDTPLMKEPAFASAIDQLALMLDARIARAMIVRLKGGGAITPHVDEGSYSEATERYHWCLATNSDCWMMAGEFPEPEMVHMAAGQVWFFDKHSYHAVINKGRTSRTHLIFDVWID